MHDARVDRRHHEGRDPGLEVGVVLRDGDVGLAKLRRVAVGAQRVGIGELPAQLGIAGGFLDDVEHARDRAARGAAAHRLDPHLHARTGLAVLLHRVLLQEMHAEVGGDRVEAAAVHDAGAGGACRAFVLADHATDPLHLAGQVAVVGAGRGADLDQRLAVERIGTDRRDRRRGSPRTSCASPPRRRRRRRSIGSVVAFG